MLKKGKWKQLFTKKRSKSGDKNKAESSVCNLCRGLPLNDVSTLCDHHREQVSSSPQQVSSSNTSVLPQNATNSARAPSGILKKSKSGSSKAALTTSVSKTVHQGSTPDNTTPQSSEENESALEPAVAESTASGLEKPLASLEQTGRTEMNEERKKDMEKEAEEKNEEFMAEEVDSANLFEHSRTENTVPIVIEPEEPKNETPARALAREDSGLRRKISFTASLPTQIFEIPSKEELKAAMTEPEEETPVLNMTNNKKSKKTKYLISKEERELRKNKRKVALTVANKVWFGTAQPEQAEEEINNELEEDIHAKQEEESNYDEDDDGDEEDDEDDEANSVEGKETQNQVVEELQEPDGGALLEWEISGNAVGQAREEVHKGDDQMDREGTSPEMNNLPLNDSSSQPSPMNPSLSEPTPLSTILPNVFLNAPLTIGNLNPDNFTDSMQLSANKEPASENPTDEEHIVKTAELSKEPHKGGYVYNGPHFQEKNNADAHRDKGFAKDNNDDDDDDDDGDDDDEDDDQVKEILQQFSHEHEVEPKITHNQSATTTSETPFTTSLREAINDAADALSPVPGQPTAEDKPPQTAPKTSLPEQPGNQATASLDQDESQTADARSHPPLEQDISQTDPNMVFGSVTLEFSNQPLFYSPNFGAQVVDPDGHLGQENITREESQYPHFSIYNEMRKFLACSEDPDRPVTGAVDTSVVGRVIEITDSEDGQNPKGQQPDVPGQSPPSLEIEEDFEQHPRRRNSPEEQKELKKE